MIDIDEFHELLNEVCDELPEDFFRELHQGVILEEGVKISPHAKSDDLIILGEYRRARYGNQITIYYGSFAKSFPYSDREFIRNKLREVVRHEFRHHMENLGGMYGRDSLEYEDKVSLHEYLAQHD
ncbi:MAG: metallopeptidase family protein [Mogibacterium sp.]|nr:metallopeptidase family protein [Mogibacterium sp.]